MPPTARHRVLLPRVVPLVFMTAASGTFAEDAGPPAGLLPVITLTPASLRLRYAYSERLELTSTTGSITTDNDLYRNYDGSAADTGEYTYDQNGRSLTQELRLNLRDWHGFTGLVGLYVARSAAAMNASPRYFHHAYGAVSAFARFCLVLPECGCR